MVYKRHHILGYENWFVYVGTIKEVSVERAFGAFGADSCEF